MCINKYEIKDKVSQFKWNCQRFKKGYSDCDTWNIYAWFLELMPKMLQEFRDNLHGHPFGMEHEDWELVIDKMIECFKEANEETCSQKNEFDLLNESDIVEAPDGYYTLKVKDESINEKWLVREHEIDDYRNQKLNEGLDLFKEYFWNLWD